MPRLGVGRSVRKPPSRSSAKARKNSAGFAQLEAWLGENDVLMLRPEKQLPPFSPTTGIQGISGCRRR